jgi:hypothetical protein
LCSAALVKDEWLFILVERGKSQLTFKQLCEQKRISMKRKKRRRRHSMYKKMLDGGRPNGKRRKTRRGKGARKKRTVEMEWARVQAEYEGQRRVKERAEMWARLVTTEGGRGEGET